MDCGVVHGYKGNMFVMEQMGFKESVAAIEVIWFSSGAMTLLEDYIGCKGM